MIKEIKIKNFLSFKQETIKLQPDVNILVGINGSGKSNFFKAIRLLKEAAVGKGLTSYIFDDLGGLNNIFYKSSGNLQENALELVFCFDRDTIVNEGYGNIFKNDVQYKIRIIKKPPYQNFFIEERISEKNDSNPEAYNFGVDLDFEYLYFLNGTGRLYSKDSFGSSINLNGFDEQELAIREIGNTSKYPALTIMKNIIKDIIVYEYFDITPNGAIRKPPLPSLHKKLIDGGANLIQLLNIFTLNHTDVFNRIVKYLKEINSDFIGLSSLITGGNNVELKLNEKGLNNFIKISGISDGTLKFLCLLVILLNPERGRFICIDEPEVGLHPDVIPVIINLIKEASSKTTFIFSTHSENMLNYFNLENLIVLEKKEINATQVRIFDEAIYNGVTESSNLGQIWKAGELGGVKYGS